MTLRFHLDQLFSSFELHHWEDWYVVKEGELPLCFRNGLLVNSGWRLGEVLVHVYPEFPWEIWKFCSRVDDIWEDCGVERKFFMSLVGYLAPSELYLVEKKDVRMCGGVGILFKHKFKSVGEIIVSLFPEIRFQVWRFEMKKRREDLCHGCLMPQDLNHVNVVARIGVKKEDNLTQKDVLGIVLPEFEWKFWKMKFEEVRESQMKRSLVGEILKYLSSALKMRELSDFYSLSLSDIMKYVPSLTNIYKSGKFLSIFLSHFPKHRWEIERFKTLPHGFWTSNINQRNSLLSFLTSTNYDYIPIEWYELTNRDFGKTSNAKTLLFTFKQRISHMFETLFPEFIFDKNKFFPISRKDFEGIEQQFSIKTSRDWYRIRFSQISSVISCWHLTSVSELIHILSFFYPTHSWALDTFLTTSKKASQRLLTLNLSFLTSEKILEDFYPPFLQGRRLKSVEFDLYLRESGMVLEYQGLQHYANIGYFGEKSREMDEEKERLCGVHGISLIQVPYFWNEKKESLRDLIVQKRADAFNSIEWT